MIRPEPLSILAVSYTHLDVYKRQLLGYVSQLLLNASADFCKQSFSKLKLIKSYLSSTVSQERLSNLATFTTENDIALSLNYS